MEPARQDHRAERCIIHAGPPKTGTTAIQNSLHAAAGFLAGQGIHYPTFAVNHWAFVSIFGPQPDALGAHRARNRNEKMIEAFNTRARKDFEAEFHRIKPHTLVISSEFFALRLREGLRDFIEYLRQFARRIDVVFYARRPGLQARSGVPHGVLAGKKRLDVDIAELKGARYREMGQSWGAVLPRDCFHFRIYSGDLVERGNVVRDFLEFIGVTGADDQLSPRRANEALSGAAVLLADALNKTHPAGDPARMPQQLFERIKGPRYQMGSDFVARVDAAKAAEIAYLRDEWGVGLPEERQYRPRSTAAEMFTDEAIESIALLINELPVDLRRARREIRQPGRKRNRD